MKIAVTYENGEVFQHFGHTERFKVYEVENGQVTSAAVIDSAGSGHGAALHGRDLPQNRNRDHARHRDQRWHEGDLRVLRGRLRRGR